MSLQVAVWWACGRLIGIVTSLYSSVRVLVRLFPAHRVRADHFEAVLIPTSLGSFLLCGGAGGSVLRYLSQLSMNFSALIWFTLYIILANTLTLTSMNDWLSAPELQATQPRVSISQATVLLIVSVSSLLSSIYQYLKSRLSLVSLWICSILKQILKWLSIRALAK